MHQSQRAQWSGRVLAAVGVAAALAGFSSLRIWAAAQQGAGGNGAASTQTAPSSTAPTIHVTTRETVVDVTVTDGKGNPVHGLTQADFTVKEDGKVQPIRSFEEFGSSPSAATQVPRNLPPNIFTNQQPPVASSAVNILLLDGLNTDPTQVGWAFIVQTRVKQEAKLYLKTMPPGTRFIMLGLSKGLRVLQSLSSDPALLSAAVDTMEINIDGGGDTMKEWGNEQDMRNRMTLEALEQIAADAASIKGKKNLIWFSTGLPTITDPRVNSAACNGCLPDYTRDLQKTYSLLAAAQVAVYPVGAPMLGAVPNDVGPGLSGPTSTAAAEEHLSYEAVAEATGGAAFYNSNDLAALVAQAVDKGANYYTLSYVPPGQKFDYAHHTINIAVDKPDLHLVYRQSYDAVDPATINPPPGLALATTPPDAHAGDMKAAMSRNMPTSTALLFYVDVEPSTTPAKPADPPVMGTLDASFKDKPLTRYAFSYSISAGWLAYTNGPNATHNGSLELDIAAYDADAKLVTSLSQTVKMSLNDTTVANKEPLNFSQQIDLPAGQLFVRVGVLDGVSNKLGTLEIPLRVEKKSAAPKSNATPAPPGSKPASGDKPAPGDKDDK